MPLRLFEQCEGACRFIYIVITTSLLKKKKRLRFGITVEVDNISTSRVSVNIVQHKRSLKLVLIIVSSFYHGMPFLTRYALATRFPLPCREGGALDFMSLGNCSVLRYSNCQIVMRTAWMYQDRKSASEGLYNPLDIPNRSTVHYLTVHKWQRCRIRSSGVSFDK